MARIPSEGGGVATFRLLALDIDGTLVNSQGLLTRATRRALGEVAAAGIHVVLVTGRQFGRTIPLAHELELSTPVVTACGALIKDPATHQTLFRAAFSEGTLPRWLEIVAQAGFEPVVYTDHFHDGYEYHYPLAQPRGSALGEFVALNFERGRVRQELVDDPPDGVFAGFAIGSREEMLSIRDALAEALPEQLDMHVMGSPRYGGILCEILPRGVSKWSGLRRVAALLGVGDHEICAVGDDVNDVPMLKGAGLGVAMGNAVPEVKQVARRLAPCHDEDGLVTVAQWLLEG